MSDDDKDYKQRQLDMVALGSVRLMNANGMNPMIGVRPMSGFKLVFLSIAVEEEFADEAIEKLRETLTSTAPLVADNNFQEENLIDHIDRSKLH